MAAIAVNIIAQEDSDPNKKCCRQLKPQMKNQLQEPEVPSLRETSREKKKNKPVQDRFLFCNIESIAGTSAIETAINCDFVFIKISFYS